jgi:hypothetical protein
VLAGIVPLLHSCVQFGHLAVGGMQLKVMVQFQGGSKGVSRIVQQTGVHSWILLSGAGHEDGKYVQ